MSKFNSSFCPLYTLVLADISALTEETLQVPESWTPKAQLVFGTPTAPAGSDKTFQPIEGQRLKIFQ